MAILNKYITAAYTLYVKDEEDKEEIPVEQCSVEHPFQFISGLGCVLPSFELQLINLPEGGDFDFVIPAKEAYGEFQDELMLNLDRKMFEKEDGNLDEHIVVGNVIVLLNEDGNKFNATVIEIGDEKVTVDLNHPRAGLDLHFVGSVIQNREATNAEITELLNAMSGGCSGGCGSCKGNCGGNCSDGEGGCEGGCGNCSK